MQQCNLLPLVLCSNAFLFMSEVFVSNHIHFYLTFYTHLHLVWYCIPNEVWVNFYFFA